MSGDSRKRKPSENGDDEKIDPKKMCHGFQEEKTLSDKRMTLEDLCADSNHNATENIQVLSDSQELLDTSGLALEDLCADSNHSATENIQVASDNQELLDTSEIISMGKSTQATETDQDEKLTQATETDQDEKSSQVTETDQDEKSTQATETDQDEKSTQATETDQDEKSTQVTETDQDEKSTQATETDQDEKSAHVTETDQDEKSAQATETDQDEKSSQATEIDQDEKSSQATEIDQDEKSSQATEIDQDEKSNQATEIDQDEKSSQATETDQDEKSSQATEIDQDEKSAQATETDQDEKSSQTTEIDDQALSEDSPRSNSPSPNYRHDVTDQWLDVIIERPQAAEPHGGANRCTFRVYNMGRVEPNLSEFLRTPSTERMHMFYHGTDAISAKKILQNGIDLTRSIRSLDFSNEDSGGGFYVSDNFKSAKEWSRRVGRRVGSFPAVIGFKITDSLKNEQPHLSLTTNSNSERELWQNTVLHFRTGRRFPNVTAVTSGVKYIEGPVCTNRRFHSYTIPESRDFNQLCIRDSDYASRFGSPENIAFVIFY